MSSSPGGWPTPGRQFAPYFSPTSEEDLSPTASPTSYELSEGRPKPSRPGLFVCNPDPSTTDGPGDSDGARARTTSTYGIPRAGLTTAANDADFETDKISGQYDRRLTSSSVGDGGPPGNPTDSNGSGNRGLVDNTPWWQNQGPPHPPEPWYKRSIAFWKKDSTLPRHLQPWWRRNKWIIALLVFLGIVIMIIGILWATGTLTGANLENFKPGDGEPGDSGTNSTSPNTSSSGTPSPTSTHPPISTGKTTKITRCDDPSTYMGSVSWAALDDGAASRTEFEPKKSAEDCCAACASSLKGCAAWIYNPSSSFTPCTNIIVTSNLDDPDDKCPKGHAGSVSAKDGGEQIAGTGPCGLSINMA